MVSRLLFCYLENLDGGILFQVHHLQMILTVNLLANSALNLTLLPELSQCNDEARLNLTVQLYGDGLPSCYSSSSA